MVALESTDMVNKKFKAQATKQISKALLRSRNSLQAKAQVMKRKIGNWATTKLNAMNEYRKAYKGKESLNRSQVTDITEIMEEYGYTQDVMNNDYHQKQPNTNTTFLQPPRTRKVRYPTKKSLQDVSEEQIYNLATISSSQLSQKQVMIKTSKQLTITKSNTQDGEFCIAQKQNTYGTTYTKNHVLETDNLEDSEIVEHESEVSLAQLYTVSLESIPLSPYLAGLAAVNSWKKTDTKNPQLIQDSDKNILKSNSICFQHSFIPIGHTRESESEAESETSSPELVASCQYKQGQQECAEVTHVPVKTHITHTGKLKKKAKETKAVQVSQSNVKKSSNGIQHATQTDFELTDFSFDYDKSDHNLATTEKVPDKGKNQDLEKQKIPTSPTPCHMKITLNSSFHREPSSRQEEEDGYLKRSPIEIKKKTTSALLNGKQQPLASDLKNYIKTSQKTMEKEEIQINNLVTLAKDMQNFKTIPKIAATFPKNEQTTESFTGKFNNIHAVSKTWQENITTDTNENDNITFDSDTESDVSLANEHNKIIKTVSDKTPNRSSNCKASKSKAKGNQIRKQISDIKLIDPSDVDESLLEENYQCFNAAKEYYNEDEIVKAQIVQAYYVSEDGIVKTSSVNDNNRYNPIDVLMANSLKFYTDDGIVTIPNTNFISQQFNKDSAVLSHLEKNENDTCSNPLQGHNTERHLPSQMHSNCYDSDISEQRYDSDVSEQSYDSDITDTNQFQKSSPISDCGNTIQSRNRSRSPVRLIKNDQVGPNLLHVNDENGKSIISFQRDMDYSDNSALIQGQRTTQNLASSHNNDCDNVLHPAQFTDSLNKVKSSLGHSNTNKEAKTCKITGVIPECCCPENRESNAWVYDKGKLVHGDIKMCFDIFHTAITKNNLVKDGHSQTDDFTSNNNTKEIAAKYGQIPKIAHLVNSKYSAKKERRKANFIYKITPRTKIHDCLTKDAVTASKKRVRKKTKKLVTNQHRTFIPNSTNYDRHRKKLRNNTKQMTEYNNTHAIQGFQKKVAHITKESLGTDAVLTGADSLVIESETGVTPGESCAAYRTSPVDATITLPANTTATANTVKLGSVGRCKTTSPDSRSTKKAEVLSTDPLINLNSDKIVPDKLPNVKVFVQASSYQDTAENIKTVNTTVTVSGLGRMK